MDMNSQAPGSPMPWKNYSPQLGQQPAEPSLNNGTVGGGVGAMVKALMDGHNQFKQRQAMQSTTGGPSVGAPMSLAPPAPGMGGGGPFPSPSPPAAGGVSPMSPFATGTDPMSQAPFMGQQGMPGGLPGMPNGIDPSIQALFSPIPGQGG